MRSEAFVFKEKNGLFLLRLFEVDERVVARLRLQLAVEEQGVVRAAANGESVEPAGAVVESPDGHGIHVLAVLQENLEERDLTNDYIIMFEAVNGGKYVKHFDLDKDKRNLEYDTLKNKLCK